MNIKQKTALCFGLILLLVLLHMFTRSLPMVGDETCHYDQIQSYVDGNMTTDSRLTMLPVYHQVMFSIGKEFHFDNLNDYRLLQIIITMLLILTFYVFFKEDVLLTLMVLFFPIMFIFNFFIYTDIMALFLVLFSFFFFQRKQYLFSAVLITVASTIRQNNLVFMLFYFLIIFFEDYKKKTMNYKENIKKWIWYFIGGCLVMLLLISNGGLVQGDKSMHPVGFHINNIWFSLFMLVVVFMPYFISKLPDVINWLKQKATNVFIPIGVVLIGLGTFSNTHHYNTYTQIWFNLFLEKIVEYWWLEIIFFLVIAYGVCVLINTKFENKLYYLFYPCIAIFMCLSLLIEPRYYITPFVLWMLLSEQHKHKFKYYTLIYFIIVSLMFFAMVIINRG